MRVFTASLATETNTFSPVPTDLDAFRAAFYAGPGEHPETPTLCSSVVPILRRRGRADGFTVIEGTSCWAEPAGLIQRETYESLRDTILAELTAALPVDGVVLGLHGAMVAQGYDDPEGDLLRRVRGIVGPDVIVAAEFDPHSHLTALRVTQLDLMAAFLEFPHTDFEERGEHVVDLALRAMRGDIRPAVSTFDCRMITIYPTSREPMRSFIDRLKAMEGRDGVLSISVIHGFMAGVDGALYPEGFFWHSEAGVTRYGDPDPEAVAALLEEAGYDGAPIRILTSRQYGFHYSTGEVAQAYLEALGIDVDLQVVDWATLTTRRADPAEWDIFITHSNFPGDPTTLNTITDTYPGWYTSDQKAEAVSAFLEAVSQEDRFAAWERIQSVIYDDAPLVKVGNFNALGGLANGVSGFEPAYWPRFWNVTPRG